MHESMDCPLLPRLLVSLESGPGLEVLVFRLSSDCALLHTPVRAPRSSTPSVPRSDSTTWNCGLAKPEMSKSKHVARVAWKRRSQLNALSEQECNPHSYALLWTLWMNGHESMDCLVVRWTRSCAATSGRTWRSIQRPRCLGTVRRYLCARLFVELFFCASDRNIRGREFSNASLDLSVLVHSSVEDPIGGSLGIDGLALSVVQRKEATRCVPSRSSNNPVPKWPS